PSAKAPTVTAAVWLLRRPISASNIRVAVEIVVVVDVNVVVAPAAAPAPTPAPERPHHYAYAKRNRQSRGIVSRRVVRVVDRRVGIDRRSIHHHRIVGRHIHDLWIGLLDHDHTFVFDNFGFNLLLLGRFQIAFVLGLLAHALHGIHHFAL